MTTRDALEAFMIKCEEALELAREQYNDGSLQGHYHDVEYSQAQQLLETTYTELMAMYRSANAQQRDRLDRMRLVVQSLQNEMTLLDHH